MEQRLFRASFRCAVIRVQSQDDEQNGTAGGSWSARIPAADHDDQAQASELTIRRQRMTF